MAIPQTPIKAINDRFSPANHAEAETIKKQANIPKKNVSGMMGDKNMPVFNPDSNSNFALHQCIPRGTSEHPARANNKKTITRVDVFILLRRESIFTYSIKT
jgi:hypothetical protein